MAEIKKDYAAIEATSLKNQIIQKLNDSGALSDQNYEGSNITQLINIFSYTHDILMFYLNKTANETLFSEAEIYENLNRLVKGLGYNPVGYQTSTLSFGLSANASLSTGTYTIPRYSYFRIGGVEYSFMDDISITKTLSGTESFDDIAENYLLYQGKVIEFPPYLASGDDNETIVVGTNGEKVDHFNIHVYVKNTTDNVWEQWERVENLYEKSSSEKVFEVRYGAKNDYTLTFGNNINGKGLNLNDQVAIYYLVSEGEVGEIGVNAINSITPVFYSSTQYDDIVIKTILSDYTVLTKKGMSNLSFANDYISSSVNSGQTVDEIRKYAPLSVKSSGRLVTKDDFNSYVRTNFRNIVLDVATLSNYDYINTYVKYFYDNGIKAFNTESRQLLSQLKFSSSCNFNNVYVVVVPRNFVNDSTRYINFLSQSQKNLIKNSCQRVKMEGIEVIPIDPIYISISFGTVDDSIDLNQYVSENTIIEITRQEGTKLSDDYIKDAFATVILDYFNPVDMTLGQELNINDLNSNLLKISGISKFYTKNASASYLGLSLVAWNDIYQKSFEIINKNKTLEGFQFPYFNLNREQIISKISIV